MLYSINMQLRYVISRFSTSLSHSHFSICATHLHTTQGRNLSLLIYKPISWKTVTDPFKQSQVPHISVSLPFEDSVFMVILSHRQHDELSLWLNTGK